MSSLANQEACNKKYPKLTILLLSRTCWVVNKMHASGYEAKDPAEMRCNISCEHRKIEGKRLFLQNPYKTATSTLVETLAGKI